MLYNTSVALLMVCQQPVLAEALIRSGNDSKVWLLISPRP